MKKQLRLRKETLQMLNPESLVRLVGGATTYATGTVMANDTETFPDSKKTPCIRSK